jgi:hypothetical protein
MPWPLPWKDDTVDLQTLEVGPDEAVEKLAEYEQALRESRTAEDAAIAAAYRAAARGLPVISLPRTVAAGGFHDSGLPRLAVIRANVQVCYVRWDGSDLVYADEDDWRVNHGAMVNPRSVRVRVARDDVPDWSARRRHAGHAMVPLVPPRHRPRWPRLENCHILWEVDEWDLVPPHDPALLRHIRGDLWSVLATWDLTDLERAVLTQRAPAQ